MEKLKAQLKEKEEETKRAINQMESYVIVLDELGKKVKTYEEEKCQALRERDHALLEMRTIRERYRSVIVGAEHNFH